MIRDLKKVNYNEWECNRVEDSCKLHSKLHDNQNKNDTFSIKYNIINTNKRIYTSISCKPKL